MQSANFRRVLLASSGDEKWKDGKELDALENCSLSDLIAKIKIQTAEQQKNVLRMLEKSLAREMDLEKRLTESREAEEDLKFRLQLEVFCMEQEAEDMWERLFEAENNAQIFFGVSKELCGQIQMAQQNNALKEKAPEAEKRDKIAEAECKLLRESNMELNADLSRLKSTITDAVNRVEQLEKQLKESEIKKQHATGDLVEASVHEATVTESTPMRFITETIHFPASVFSKSQEVLITKFVLSSGAALLLHPSKVLTGGEDAYFVSDQTWLGVADGVGLWSFQGTSPGVYAQELMKNCERLVSVKSGDSINNPVELLNLSVAETDSPGSSTVLISQFDGQALHVANVGDSGFIVLRNGAIHKRSSPMNHAYYFPMQIEKGDDPSSLAELYRVDVEEGDVIITATDGLLDNLYDQEILLIVMKSLAANKKLQEIAEKLALKAQEIGRSVSVRTPFGDDAQAAGFAGYTGGKLDDVAVIVSIVQRQ